MSAFTTRPHFKRNHRIWLSILLTTVFNLSSAHATAAGPQGPKCESVYYVQPSWQKLPDVHATDLDQDFLKELDRNPKAAALSRKYSQGRDVILEFKEVMGKGWAIQMKLLKSLIQHLLPEAQTRSSAKKYRVYLSLVDSSMNYNAKIATYLQMGLMKALNPGSVSESKEELRALMNIPLDARVFSVYDSSADDASLTTRMAEGVLLKDQADIVILSDKLVGGYPINGSDRIQYVPSERWVQLRPIPHKKYIILNNTHGRMNAIYKASDLAIVLGGGNIYEPINMGIPVFFEKVPGIISYRGTYAAWKEIAERALRTHMAFSFSRAEEAFQLIKNYVPLKVPNKTFNTPNDQGLTPFDEFLNQLDEALGTEV